MSVNIYQFLKIGLVAIGLMVAHLADASVYYIDYSAGSDSNTGISTSSAWQHCPGDTNATANAASTILQPGDTVYFKGGINYVLTAPFLSSSCTPGILVQCGTPANPITYDGNSAGTWGSGHAILTDNFSTNKITAFNAYIMSNIVINSFCFTNIGGSNAFPVGNFSTSDGFPAKPGGGISANTMLNVKIENCNFSRLGYWQEFPTNIGNASLSGGGISASICDGVVITNCEFDRMRSPIFFGVYGTWNLSVLNCYFHDEMEWALTVTCVNSYRSNVVISGCVFSNTDQYYVGTGQGGLWQGYGGGGPHENAIMMFNGEGETGSMGLDRFPGDTNVFIYDNKFITTMGKPGGSTGIWLQDGTSGFIYNNIFYLSAANNAVNVSGDFTNTPTKIGIYNNTFYSGNLAIVVSSSGYPAWPSVQTNCFIKIENNVISTLNSGNNNAYDYEIGANDQSHLTNNVLFDFNSYYSDQLYYPSGSMIFGLYYPATYISLESRGTYGWDYNSNTNLSPPFVSPVHVAPFNYDLHLLTNSPAIGAGINLTSLNLPGLNMDADGNQRPPTGPWTIGAYQGTSTAPFVSLVALPPSITNGQSSTLSWSSANVTNVTLNGFGTVALTGTTNVFPDHITTYTITASGTNGTASAKVTVMLPLNLQIQ